MQNPPRDSVLMIVIECLVIKKKREKRMENSCIIFVGKIYKKGGEGGWQGRDQIHLESKNGICQFLIDRQP